MLGQPGTDAGPEALLTHDLDSPGAPLGPAPSPLPIPDPDSIAAGLLDRHGRMLATTPAFARLAERLTLDPDLVRKAARGAGPLVTTVDLDGPAATADTAAVALRLAEHTTPWRLPEPVASAAREQPGGVVVLSADLDAATGPLEVACRAFGLTAAQARVAVAVIRHGEAPAAARALGVSPHTLRETLEAVKARVGVKRLPALVLRLASHGFGLLPDAGDAEALIDIWGLTERQAALASLVASGFSRREAARALGLSEAVVKKELDQGFQILGVGSAAALGRRLAEARAMAWLMRATAGEVGFLDPVAEPLRFVLREDGGRIAISDFGPASGRPVIVSHTSLTTRTMPRRLLDRLHAAGYRPITLDRPGFGLTDPAASPEVHDRTAAADVVRVLDHLRLARADLVVRGAPGWALALQDQAPERLGAVVLANPSVRAQNDRRAHGFWGVLKASYKRNPRSIALWVTHLSRWITPERHQALMRRWLAGSPADEAAVEDPVIARDYFLAQRMFATGHVAGYVAEQAAYLSPMGAAPRPGLRWRILVGGQDTLHDPAEVESYWRALLPDAEIRVAPEAGRLLALSHPDLVVRALGG